MPYTKRIITNGDEKSKNKKKNIKITMDADEYYKPKRQYLDERSAITVFKYIRDRELLLHNHHRNRNNKKSNQNAKSLNNINKIDVNKMKTNNTTKSVSSNNINTENEIVKSTEQTVMNENDSQV